MQVIIGYIINAVLGWFAKFFANQLKAKQAADEIKEKNAELRKANEAAKTKEERDKAASDIINNF